MVPIMLVLCIQVAMGLAAQYIPPKAASVDQHEPAKRIKVLDPIVVTISSPRI